MDALSQIAKAQCVVLKVGSALVVRDGTPADDWLAALAADIADLRASGVRVLVVSSGSVALGRSRLNLGKGKLRLEQKQAAAAAGQSALMAAWERAFAPHHLPTAQALLTSADTEIRRRWLNGRLTLETLLGLGAIPIINENDTVATEEIRVGDNDRLAARVAQMVSADLLILFSDIDGLYTADPRHNPDAAHIPLVPHITPDIDAMAGGANALSGVGTGGMATKIIAARMATNAGCSVLITKGERLHPLSHLARGQARATLFPAASDPAQAYKSWIAGTLNPRGAISIDAGAARALAQGKSLLPAGVVAIDGQFEKGDAVRVLGPDSTELARGIIAYDASDAQKLIGRRSSDFEALLGYEGTAYLIHADDLSRARPSPKETLKRPDHQTKR